MKLFSKLKQTLSRTASGLSESFQDIFIRKKLDDDMCEALEEALIMSDMGAEVALSLVEKLRAKHFDTDITEQQVRTFLANEIAQLLAGVAKPLTLPARKPAVILMVGVNGSGKTTSIGKLTRLFKAESHTVMLAAGDTFRAGAVDQLTVWAERTASPITTPEKDGADAAGVLYKAYSAAQDQNCDILLADTAGRLQNRKELMDELAKIVRVLKKQDETAPHHTLLVIDATVGQNAFSQVQAFVRTADVSGLIITKLDSSAKGGAVVGLAHHFGLPIHFIGHGESVDDLTPFDAHAFASNLMDIKTEEG